MLHRKMSLCVATSRAPGMESRTEQVISGVGGVYAGMLRRQRAGAACAAVVSHPPAASAALHVTVARGAVSPAAGADIRAIASPL
jgi:hypothetical protein